MVSNKGVLKKLFILGLVFLLLGIFISGTAEASDTSGIKVIRKKGCVIRVTRDGKTIRSEWLTIKGKKYYVGVKGAPVTGWKKIKGKKYYFNEKGILQKNTLIGNQYVGKDGACVKKGNWPLSALKQMVQSKIKTFSGTWSVYMKDLKTGESFCLNDRPMYAASLIKLYAMAALYDRINKKKAKEKNYSSLLNAMITVSSNSAYNRIVGRIGRNTLNRWIRKNGYKKTVAVHNVGLISNNTIVRRGGKKNLTTASECGKLLESIHRNKCVSRRCSKAMLKLLKKQRRRSKIPKLLPKSVTVANKTGETDEVCHDAAIVYGPKRNYILVIMVTDPGRAWSRAGDIARLSRSIYDWTAYL